VVLFQGLATGARAADDVPARMPTDRTLRPRAGLATPVASV
jgi:hypothetical protein